MSHPSGKILFTENARYLSKLFVNDDQKAGLDLYYEIHPTEVLILDDLAVGVQCYFTHSRRL